MLPHCFGITDLNVHVGFEFKVADRAEFDTADPPWQGFGVLRKMCDVLSHIGCVDEAKDIAAAAHALVACSRKPSEYKPACALQWEGYWQKAEAESSMINPSGQNIFERIISETKQILHEFSTLSRQILIKAVEEEKFEGALLVKTVREKIVLTTQTSLDQFAASDIAACIAGTEQIFKNMLKDLSFRICQFAFPVLQTF